MPRTETVIRIFVASPADVTDERLKMEEIVSEVNVMVGVQYSMRFELVKWEMNTAPSVGADAQQIINKQINDDYDIFVGIMWTRFGSSTGRFDSGTEEEFYRAKQRYDRGEDVDIMFYFKDEAISPSSIDLRQLDKVQTFQKEISENGIYYWQFKNLDEFAKAFRLHLSKKMNDYVKSSSSPEKVRDLSVGTLSAYYVEEEIGLLDLQFRIEAQTPKIEKLVEKLSVETSWIAERLNIHTAATTNLSERSMGMPSSQDAFLIINEAADDIEKYAAEIDGIKTDIVITMSEGFQDIFKLIILQKASNGGEIDIENASQFQNLKMVISETKKGLEVFIGTINQMPPLTSKLNAAKRHVRESLGTILSELQTAERLFVEALG